MADYYTPQQLAQKLGIAEATITELQSSGLIQPTVKDGRSFLSFTASLPPTRRPSLGTQRQNRFEGSFRKSGRTLAGPEQRAETIGLSSRKQRERGGLQSRIRS